MNEHLYISWKSEYCFSFLICEAITSVISERGKKRAGMVFRFSGFTSFWIIKNFYVYKAYIKYVIFLKIFTTKYNYYLILLRLIHEQSQNTAIWVFNVAVIQSNL